MFGISISSDSTAGLVPVLEHSWTNRQLVLRDGVLEAKRMRVSLNEKGSLMVKEDGKGDSIRWRAQEV